MTPEEQELQKLVAEIAFHHRAAPEKNGTARDILRAAIRAAEDAARADGWRDGAEAMREAVIKRLDEALPELAGWTELTALPIPEPGTGEKGE